MANATGTIRLTAAWGVSARVSYLGGRPLTPLDVAVSSAQRRAVYDLERVPSLEASPYGAALDAARANGLDVDRLVRRTHHGPDA